MTQRQMALVTGSTSGIGLGIALSLAEAGYCLILNGFGEPEVIDQAVADVAAISASPPLYVGTDMTQPQAIETALAEIIASEGPISVLVNNAGMQFTAPIDEFPTEKWDQIIALNLSAAFHTTRLCLPGMRTQNFGRIINIASVHGLDASINKPAYVAAKHGLIGLTKATALETAEIDITCNAICPGWTYTSLIQAQIEKADADLRRVKEESRRELEQMKEQARQEIERREEAVRKQSLVEMAAKEEKVRAEQLNASTNTQEQELKRHRASVDELTLRLREKEQELEEVQEGLEMERQRIVEAASKEAAEQAARAFRDVLETANGKRTQYLFLSCMCLERRTANFFVIEEFQKHVLSRHLAGPEVNPQ